MIKTIFMGDTYTWTSREDAIRIFECVLRYNEDAGPEILDRVNTVLDNLRAGKDPAVDFETAE